MSGFFQGGVAEGLMANRKAELAEQQLGLRGELGRRELELAEQRQAFNEKRTQNADVMQQIQRSTANIVQTAESLRQAGKSPQEIQSVLQEAIVSVSDLAESASPGNGSVLADRLNAQISVPAEVEPTIEDSAREEVGALAARRDAIMDRFGLSEEEANAQVGIKPQQQETQNHPFFFKMNKSDQSRFLKAKQAQTQLKGELQRFSQLVKETGVNIVPGTPDAKRIDQQRNIIVEILKELGEHGALQKADLEFLQSIVPTVNVIGNGKFNSPAGFDDLLGNLEQSADGRIKAYEQVLNRIYGGKKFDEKSDLGGAPQSMQFTQSMLKNIPKEQLIDGSELVDEDGNLIARWNRKKQMFE